MDEPLLTIGAFARAVGLTASALRYYDECGLLVPAQVDAATGYRYYTPDLARRARLVVGMREAGVPVETMRTVLDATGSEGAKALREFLDAEAVRRARVEESLGDVLDAVGEAGPDRPAVPASVRIEGPVLAAAIRQVRAAADSEPSSPLAGVLVDLEDGAVDVVATNRYWMALRSPYADVAGDPARTVLDLAEVEELAAVLDRRGRVDASVSEGRLEIDGLTWGSGVAYPAHRMLFAGVPEAVTRVVVASAELLAAVRAEGRAEVDLAFTDSGVEVGEIGEVGIGVAGGGTSVAATVIGPGLSLRMSAALLTRAVETCLGPAVVLEAGAEDRPMLLRSPYQPDVRALVMPIAR